MDRIEMQGSNGILARLRARGLAPVTRAEPARPTESEPDPAGAVALAAIGLAGSDAPVDSGRVKEIREAIEKGRYPLDPGRTADAIIAAGFMLRNEQ